VALIRAWEAWFFGPVRLARPALLLRAVLLVLAFDGLLELVGHGARYGVGGFNVAHFRWLDAIQPVPTPALYVGVVTGAAAGALAAALTPGSIPRALLAAVAGLYTWGWAMSMIDSYQHHYFLSLLLVAFVFFPSQRPLDDAGERGCAWGWVLVCAIVAIVYAYTGRVKLEPAWLEGDVLRRVAEGAGIGSGEGPDGTGGPGGWVKHELARMSADARASGGTEAVDLLWRRLGRSVFPVQFLLALAYLVAPLRDRPLPRAARVVVVAVTAIAFPTAVGFHWAADAVLELRIGWFGAYMVALALVAFAPGPWLTQLVEGGRGIVARAAAWSRETVPENGRVLGAGLLGAVGSMGWFVGLGSVDLPGVPWVGVVAGVLAAGVVAGALFRGRTADAGRAGLVAVGVALLVTASLTLGPARYDYWRYAGGDAYRRRDWASAVPAYEKALRYAPASVRGTDAHARRARKLERARRALAADAGR